MRRPKSVLIVMSHPDDEIIFGYPYFQKRDMAINLLVCSSDIDNPECPHWHPRKEVLERICADRGVELEVIDGRSDFYRLPTHSNELCEYRQEIADRLVRLEQRCDITFTHNPHGEYGHFDHRTVFEVVAVSATNRVYYTDIRVNLGKNWPLPPSMPWYYRYPVEQACLDVSLYERYRKYYQDAGVWTWVDDTVPECRVFRMPRIPRH